MTSSSVCPCLRSRLAAAIVVAASIGLLTLCASPVRAEAGASAPGSAPLTAPAGGEPGHAQLPLTVTIDPFDPAPPVPTGFLGLSFEASALSQITQYAHRGDLVDLLRSLGPGVLRFGGITADENVAWSDGSTPPPPWASSVVGPAQMRALGALARRSGWRVLLTVGLAHYEPTAAAREVAAADSALGPYLAAVEIGNEPDSYGAHGLRQLPWIAQGYEEEVSSYREAIGALTPGVPIAGPDVSGSGSFAEWGEEEALAQKPLLLTGHHYPLGCAQTPAPSIESLLSDTTRGREARSLATYMAVSHLNGIPLRIDETNSVSCGGVAGISDTFASALWATAYITQAMAAGAAGINLQGNPTNCIGYTPLCAANPEALTTGTLSARPEWYSLLLSRSLIGARPLPTTIDAEDRPEGAPNLVATSFAEPDHSIAAVIVNDEPQSNGPLALALEVGAGFGPVRIERLTASSPGATGGVLLGGRQIAADGSWSGPAQTEDAAVHAGILALALAPASAVLVTISPPRAASRPRRDRRRRLP